MIQTLSDKANEESTYIITCNFVDEDDTAVIPDTLSWTLTDLDGTVINSRSNVSVAVPTASYDIVLYGDDLAMQTGETSQTAGRKLTISATYTSDAGTGLPLKDEVIFFIENFTNVS